MKILKYTIIKTKSQYKEYCKELEGLVDMPSKNKAINDEIDLLTYLIKKWDEEHSTFNDIDPIEVLHSFMEDHKLKANDLAKILRVSKGYISDILNYKKGLSKEIIRNLSMHFKVYQELFNRPYKLKSPINSHLKNASVMNTKKEFASTR